MRRFFIDVLVSFFFFSIISGHIEAQQKLAPDIYLLKFTDKKLNSYTLDNPSAFLSERAIKRRLKQDINIQESDLPVSSFYTDSITKLGFEIIHTSKWLNAVAVYISDTSDLQLIRSLGFVLPFLKSTATNNKRQIINKFPGLTEDFAGSYYSNEYGPSYNQIAMHNGQFLHSLGFKGKGILIAVLDAGFYAVKDYSSLNKLWYEKRVLLTRDFVDKTGDSFYTHQHGSNVLSIMAGYSPGNLIGTAPEADYILLRTENAASEYPIEEFNWVAGAELADSMGSDIIHSSLGYSTFSESEYNYTYSQMDGKHAISSIGAQIAASKGIIVVTSAGNEGAVPWKYITAPADADSILAVGAVDSIGNRAYFSSFGPSSDKRIKPDVVAKGYATYIQASPSLFMSGNGTSYAAPVISGLTACLWQALPNLSNMNLINAIKNYASRADNPDTIIGYGIPDYKKILTYLNPAYYQHKGILFVYPNPYQSSFTMEFEAVKSNLSVITVTDLTGKVIFKGELKTNTNTANEFHINELKNIPKGIYIIKVSSGIDIYKTKIIKI